ncbi:Hypothetical predicted protein [Mytilus galloprovincialis]|uniref:Uncharacterized protein n=1 Tax=Mytilus galloprovincialis TaxID=29158 RepID=A0A8B6FCQ3_MYTGA|nr:Hypothetical predicted protein [Mytilus galloprovincialis]
MQKERLVCGYECIVRRICDIRRKDNGVQKEKEKLRKTPCSSRMKGVGNYVLFLLKILPEYGKIIAAKEFRKRKKTLSK